MKKQEKKGGQGRKLGSDKILIIAIIILVVIFGALFSWKYFYSLISKPKIMTIDELHAENAKGKLDPGQGYMYNNFSFVYSDGLWFTQMRRSGTNTLYDIRLHFGPRDLKDIFVIGNDKQFLNYNYTYITFAPSGKQLQYVALAAAELSINMAMVLNMEPIAACTLNETSACMSRPIIDCSSTTEPTIYLEESNMTGVSVRDNCVTISGSGIELVKATDALLLKWYGVIRD